MTMTASPAPTRTAAARADHLTKVYGEGSTAVTAVDDLSVAFDRGTFTAIMGQSGSGKSTLMHCMAGLDRTTSGHTFIGDADLTTLNDNRLTTLRRDRVGFVFQSFNLLPTLTARQNIQLPLDLAGRPVDTAHFDAVVNALGLGDRLGHRPAELSGGQQQRVAIARALLTRPEVLFADEPTGALDSRTGTEVLDHLRSSVDELGQTIVMVTHDPRAASYADRVLIMSDGRIHSDLTEFSTQDLAIAMGHDAPKRGI